MMREMNRHRIGNEKTTRFERETEPGRSDGTFAEGLRAYESRAAGELAGTRSRSPLREWIAFTSAATAASAMAGTAEAAVIYSGPQNLDVGPISVGGYSSVDNVDIDLDGDLANDFRVGVFAFYYGSFIGGDVRALQSGGAVARNGTPARQFASGSTIGASADFDFDRAALFDYSGGSFNSNFGWNTNGSVGFAGVKFDDRYGWIQIEVTAANHMVVVDWAYESEAGKSIKAGATVPEPSAGALTGLGLLALGAEGVRRQRSRSR